MKRRREIITPDGQVIDESIRNALREDIGSGDVTVRSVIPAGHSSRAVLSAKQDLVLAGLPFAERTFLLVNSSLKFVAKKKDGDRVMKGEPVAEVRGDTGSLLQAERVALNILQRLSGIATLTSRFVSELGGHKVRIVDTRKTTPGFRVFEKYAVRAGGGYNHRFGLFDGLLIKDNHIRAAGGLKKAVRRARANAHHLLKVEAEVRNITEVREALSAGVDMIMFDNMPLERMRRAVSLIRSSSPGTIIEASGNVGLDSLREIASSGVDLISVGEITHSAAAVDINMSMKPYRGLN
jgi:nicotinate-nucleotide pyrophosphorylase (carboxylating)